MYILLLHWGEISLLKKRKLKRIIGLILFIAILASAGGILFNSGILNNSTPPSAVIDGSNVSFTARGWFQREGDESRTRLVNGNGADDGFTVSVRATDSSKISTLEVDNTTNDNKVFLQQDKRYVLFTYEFTNTALGTEGDMEVSLTLSSTEGNNLKAVKYATDTYLYTECNFEDFIDTLSSNEIFVKDNIMAGGHVKYYYILFEIDDLLQPVSFFPYFTWTLRGMTVGSK